MASSEEHSSFIFSGIGNGCPGKVFIFDGEDSIDRMNRMINKREMLNGENFVTVRTETFDICARPKERIFWQEHTSDLLPIKYDGVPFQFVGRQTRDCWKGRDKHRSDKSNRNETKSEHSYNDKSRRLIHSTTKEDCGATIIARLVIRFPDYKIQSDSTHHRKVKSTLLKKDIASSNIRGCLRLYVFISDVSCHNHVIGEIGSVNQRLDKAIIDRIHCLVGDGIRRTDEMERAIFGFAKREFPTASRLNSRYYPSRKIIRNHMFSAMCVQQFSSDDFENLGQNVEKWKKELPGDNFHYTSGPMEDIHGEENDTDLKVEEFLFVYQSKEQKRLLERYGGEICLLDATYKTCKFEVPLFFLCVPTNSGYVVVGLFVLPHETTYHIKRGLEVLKSWNPTWNPQYFITDYDRKELNAIEDIFPDCFTFLCDFHREKSWKNWVTPSNGVTNKKEVLELFRCIANASNEQGFNDAVDALKRSCHWRNNEKLQNWFENYWLKESKRWVQYHRNILENKMVNTTNGLERQNRELKQNYLCYYTEGSLTSMISTLVTRYVPESCRRYAKKNIEWISKSYSSQIPDFLTYKARFFIDHCMDRLMIEPVLRDYTKTGDNSFTVISDTSGSQYLIDLGGTLPSCTCLDWNKHHLPCKHMLYIIMHVPGQGWNSLSEHFRNSPRLNVDEQVISGHVQQKAKDTVDITTPGQSNTKIRFSRLPSKTKLSVKTKCQSIAKAIDSMLYLLPADAKCDDLLKDMSVLYKKVRKMIPSDAGMFIRPGKRGRKCFVQNNSTLNHRKKRQNKTRVTAYKKKVVPCKAEEKSRVVPQDSIIVIEEEDGYNCKETLDQTSEKLDLNQQKYKDVEEKLDQTQKEEDALQGKSSQSEQSNNALDVLWNISSKVNKQVLQIGPYLLTTRSFEFLKSTLSDEVIDCYMTILVRNRRVLYIDCINSTSIFGGRPQLADYLKTKMISNYECCLAVANEGGHHWVLIIIVPKDQKIIYLNPLGEKGGSFLKYQQKWETLMRLREQLGLFEPTQWECVTLPHARQRDSVSCGVFSLMFAKKYLNKESLLFGNAVADVKAYRREIGETLISATDSFLDRCLDDDEDMEL